MVKGLFYDGQSSRGLAAELTINREGILTVRADGLEKTAPCQEITFSSRIGNTPRFIRFKDGAQFETRDNDGIDRYMAALHGGRHNLAHLLESRLSLAIFSLAIVAAFTWGFIKYGIPWTAAVIAGHLPFNTSLYLSNKTLEIMDKDYFQETEIPETRQNIIREQFVALTEQQNTAYDYNIKFRKSNRIGANAFALPSGTVIVTDKLIEIAANDDQIISILAHEIGHVENRHGLRQMAQSSMLSFLVLWITGDVSGASTFITTLPVLMADLSYSRNFEQEADRFALSLMQKMGINPYHFACIMEKLEESHRLTTKQDITIPEFLSTHPNTVSRIETFKQAGKPMPCG